MFFFGTDGLAAGDCAVAAAAGAPRGAATGMAAGRPGPATVRAAGITMPGGGRPGPPPSAATRAAVSR